MSGSPAHSHSYGPRSWRKWTAAANLQPTLPKPDRLLALLTGASEEYPDTPSQARDGGWDVALMGERLIPTTLLHRRDRNLPGTSGCLTWPDHDFNILIEGG